MKKVLFGFLGLLFILFTLNSCSSDDGKYCNSMNWCFTLDDGNYTLKRSVGAPIKGTYKIDGQKITFTPNGGSPYDGELERNNNKLILGQTVYKKVE